MIVLTRNRGYQKEPVSHPLRLLLEKKYREYPGLIKAMLNRYMIYNETLDYIDESEQKGQTVVIRPSRKLEVDRFEKNAEKLTALYNQGFEDANMAYDRIKSINEG
ncbi:MAG TPA: hypothetical protein GX520_02935 [Syntrophaceticus sp.]|uniref:DUF6363 domain-containing protein n=1 Tax=Syntrophaceticus schinkii TaxID=499207 RepID=A0A0B7MIH9_9FIRM|nr:DUF6363 domain-containing protein [Syntrophaceticus schinkii]HHY29635.1 hypothetical protein [Syntrophaceticus sp.]MDD2359310.1 hypothetical protein [Syntrophaceticus schinkii]MDD4261453.1 hypothetical protein [Syntrophaceticus schinkii]MDD4675271.1 hypothetical protein [Syntrophaceticus schinkii]CEO90449.1 conserved hypothetical protein [Syntrophaceticus schinkii]